MDNGGLRALGVLPVKFRDDIIAVMNIASHACDTFPDDRPRVGKVFNEHL